MIILNKEILKNLESFHMREAINFPTSFYIIAEVELKNLTEIAKPYAKELREHNERVKTILSLLSQQFTHDVERTPIEQAIEKKFGENINAFAEHIQSWEIFMAEVLTEMEKAIQKILSLQAISKNKLKLQAELLKMKNTVTMLKDSIQNLHKVHKEMDESEPVSAI